jgi:hypothetical protein
MMAAPEVQQKPKMADKKPVSKKPEKTIVKAEPDFVFGRDNYILMIAGVLIIFIGFALMYGKEDIFDFRKLTLAPIVVLSGFVVEIFAVMKKSKS